MAEIPVERKSGTAWWLWLLLGLLVLALVWWLIAENDDDAEDRLDDSDRAAQIEPADDTATAGGTIGDLDTLLAGSLATMVGRSVDLDSVEVESLAGDMAFYIGSDASNRALVAFDQVRTPDDSDEGRLDINPGDTVSLQGVVTRLSDLPAAVQTDMDEAADTVIRATRLSLAEGDTLNPEAE